MEHFKCKFKSFFFTLEDHVRKWVDEVLHKYVLNKFRIIFIFLESHKSVLKLMGHFVWKFKNHTSPWEVISLIRAR